jgi:hypothetical protein
MEKSICEKISRRTSLVEEKYQIKQVLRRHPLDEKTALVEGTGSNVATEGLYVPYLRNRYKSFNFL